MGFIYLFTLKQSTRDSNIVYDCSEYYWVPILWRRRFVTTSSKHKQGDVISVIIKKSTSTEPADVKT